MVESDEVILTKACAAGVHEECPKKWRPAKECDCECHGSKAVSS